MTHKRRRTNVPEFGFYLDVQQGRGTPHAIYLNMNSTANNNYVAKTRTNGQIDIIPARNAHKQHVWVSWYDGGGCWMGGAVPADEAATYRPNARERSERPIEWRSE